MNEIIGVRVRLWDKTEGRVLAMYPGVDSDGDPDFIALLLVGGELLARSLQGAQLVRAPDETPARRRCDACGAYVRAPDVCTVPGCPGADGGGCAHTFK